MCLLRQQNYRAYGACEERGREFVRAALPDEPMDPSWRPIDPARDSFEDWDSDEQRAPWPTDYTVLYWWTDAFWRAG